MTPKFPRCLSLLCAALTLWAALACGGADDGALIDPLPTPASALTAEDSAGEQFTAGAKVKAVRSKDPKVQNASFISQYGKLAKLKFADHNTGWVNVKEITPAGAIQPLPAGDSCDASEGDRVMAPWSTSYSKFAGKVGERYGKMAFIQFDDGERDWADCEALGPIPEPTTGGGGGGGVSEAVTKCQRGCNSQCKNAQNKSKCVADCRRACAR